MLDSAASALAHFALQALSSLASFGSRLLFGGNEETAGWIGQLETRPAKGPLAPCPFTPSHCSVATSKPAASGAEEAVVHVFKAHTWSRRLSVGC